MTCSDREQDLLLQGVGELTLWQSLLLSLHTSRCERCRGTQARFLAASGRMAEALKPPGGSARIVRRAAPALLSWFVVACVAAAIGLLIVAGTAVAIRYGTSWGVGSTKPEVPCRPDLPNDKCR
jgi:hypothetical protein